MATRSETDALYAPTVRCSDATEATRRIKVLEEVIDRLVERILDHGIGNLTGQDVIELIKVRYPSETK